jgi:hypothetical protein
MQLDDLLKLLTLLKGSEAQTEEPKKKSVFTHRYSKSITPRQLTCCSTSHSTAFFLPKK